MNTNTNYIRPLLPYLQCRLPHYHCRTRKGCWTGYGRSLLGICPEIGMTCTHPGFALSSRYSIGYRIGMTNSVDRDTHTQSSTWSSPITRPPSVFGRS